MGSMGAGFGVAHGFEIGGIEKTGQRSSASWAIQLSSITV
jgi:hypothetical protein